MFTKSEIQVVAKTLMHRREWLTKNINNPEMQASKTQNQQTLELIDSALSKLASLNQNTQSPSTQNSAAPMKGPGIDLISTPAKPIRMSPANKRAEMEPGQIKVLVVDDDNLIAQLMTTLLQAAGIKKVDIAEDGLKAITMLYDANPVYDLVLCDWHMPIKNGIDVHNAMRAVERYIDTCFILVTAVTEAKQIKSAIEEGVDDYIVKPIEEQKTLKKLNRHFPKITAN